MNNIKIWRWLLGGTWVKREGRWQQALVARFAADGTKFLRVGTETFHETYLGIQALETYK